MEATHLRRPWLHSPGWTTQGPQLCPVVASSQGQVAAGVGPVPQPVRAPRWRWQLCGKVETGRRAECDSQRGRERDFILFCTRERLQQGKGPVTWVSVGVAFYIWDQGGPAEVTLKLCSGRGWGEKHSCGTVPELCGTLRRPGRLRKNRAESEK